jgi:hypothetical protein
MMECRGKKRENTGESRYKQPHQHSIDDMANDMVDHLYK